MAFQDIFNISPVEQVFQIPALFFMCFKRCDKRHTAISIVILPGTAFIAFVLTIKFCKRKRIHPYLIASVSKLRQDIGRQHSGIASGHIHICIFHLHKTEDNIDKGYLGIGVIYIRVLYFSNKLNLIDKNIIFFPISNHPVPYIFIKFDWITILCIFPNIQCQSYDMILMNSFTYKPITV